MGTALNVALSQQYTQTHNLTIDFHTLEAFPVTSEIFTQLDYFQGVQKEHLIELHELSWEQKHHILANFSIYKENVKFESFGTTKKFDIIYFDAFAPSCQPHLWEEKVLQVAYNALNTGGILVTFCAKGSFKRALKSLGFQVDGIPGPPRKREMVRATKPH